MVENMENSILAAIGSGIAWIFTPLGWGNWKPAVAAITGLVAKENVVGTFGILYGFGEVDRRRRGNLGNTLRGDDAGCGVFIPCI